MTADGSSTSLAQSIAHEIRALADEIRTLPVAPTVTADAIRQRLASYTFAEQVSLPDAISDVSDMLRQGTLHATHPRYFGLFVPGVHEAGIWADTLAALYNPQLGAWWHAPAASEIETHTLQYLARVIGYDATHAHFTSGGSEANLTALLAAIVAAYPNAVQCGVGEAAAHGVVYVSSQSHHSIHKAVRIAGLGDGALRVIPCDAQHTMDLVALRETVAMDAAAGRKTIMMVGTVGTTTAGAVDDLGAIGALARANKAWFHVDAAWGGAAGFAEQLRPLLHGIDQADSVTWDAHKWLSVPMGAGMFFCRRPEMLRALFNVEADYVPKDTGGGEDLYLMSLQWSRRFIGLKVFLTLATLGQGGVTARILHQLGVADYLRLRLRDAGWIVVNRSALPVVCFVHPALTSRESVADVARRIALRGRAWISAAMLPERPVLRACITNEDTSCADVDILCEELERALDTHQGHCTSQ